MQIKLNVPLDISLNADEANNSIRETEFKKLKQVIFLNHIHTYSIIYSRVL